MAWRHGMYRVSGTPSCHQVFSPLTDLALPRAGVPLVRVSKHVVVSTDASAMGWVAMCNEHAAAGLACSAPLQTAVTRQACTDPYGQHCDRCLHQTPRWSTLPSHVVTCPPFPPLESEASEQSFLKVTSCFKQRLQLYRNACMLSTSDIRSKDVDLFRNETREVFMSH